MQKRKTSAAELERLDRGARRRYLTPKETVNDRQREAGSLRPPLFMISEEEKRASRLPEWLEDQDECFGTLEDIYALREADEEEQNLPDAEEVDRLREEFESKFASGHHAAG
jgi:hypothetical protein